jgi:hypothetical protein
MLINVGITIKRLQNTTYTLFSSHSNKAPLSSKCPSYFKPPPLFSESNLLSTPPPPFKSCSLEITTKYDSPEWETRSLWMFLQSRLSMFKIVRQIVTFDTFPVMSCLVQEFQPRRNLSYSRRHPVEYRRGSYGYGTKFHISRFFSWQLTLLSLQLMHGFHVYACNKQTLNLERCYPSSVLQLPLFCSGSSGFQIV